MLTQKITNFSRFMVIPCFALFLLQSSVATANGGGAASTIATRAISGATNLSECLDAVSQLRDAAKQYAQLFDSSSFLTPRYAMLAFTFSEAANLAESMCYDKFTPGPGAGMGTITSLPEGLLDGIDLIQYADSVGNGIGPGEASVPTEPGLGTDILGLIAMGRLTGIAIGAGMLGVGAGSGTATGGGSVVAAEGTTMSGTLMEGLRMAASVLAGVFGYQSTSHGADGHGADSSYGGSPSSTYGGSSTSGSSGHSSSSGSTAAEGSSTGGSGTTSSEGSYEGGGSSSGTSVDCAGICEEGASVSTSNGEDGTVTSVSENEDGSVTVGIDTDGDGEEDVSYTGEPVGDEEDCEGSDEDCEDGGASQIFAESEACRMQPWKCAMISEGQLDELYGRALVEEFMQSVQILVISDGEEEYADLSVIAESVEDLGRYGYEGYSMWEVNRATSVEELKEQLEIVMGLDSMVRVTIGVRVGFEGIFSHLVNERDVMGERLSSWWPLKRVNLVPVR